MNQSKIFKNLSLGYSLAESLSELADNSITHNSKNIFVYMYWADDYGRNSFVMVVDDGDGMSEDDLLKKAFSVQENRPDGGNNDLGLYGMGLKTGSFQHCNKITILTKKNKFLKKSLDCEGVLGDKLPSCYENSFVKNQIEELKKTKTGTIIIWSQLEKLVESRSRDTAINFYNEYDKARKHFKLIYNDFLSNKGINIYFGGSKKENLIKPYDPFFKKNIETKKLEDIKVNFYNSGDANLSTWIIPKYTEKEDTNFTRNEMQGIYFYRRGRLISFGGWYGLGSEGPPEEWGMNDKYNRLRIRIEIPDQDIKHWLSTSKNKIVIPEFAVRSLYKKISLLRKQYLDYLKLEKKTDPIKNVVNLNPPSKIDINGLSEKSIIDLKNYINELRLSNDES